MFRLLFPSIRALIRLFRSRRNLVLENLVLRQQLAVLSRRHSRPSLGLIDKLFWVIARRVWSARKQYLIIVTPETVVRWHRTAQALA
jgi:putative transposase